MKKILLLFFCCTHFLALSQQSLSDQAQISVLTLGPYQGELYSAFGHSAIRVYDPALGIDDAYNWGVFDFDQPNFYLNFARGYLYYKLGVYPYDRFRDYYIYYNRYVHEQPLLLTSSQKQKLFDYLTWNRQPENQHYRYDYFYNNCATKVRDVLVTVFGDSVTFNGSYIKTDYTIRQLTDLYLKQQPWGDLGIDICLGLPMDKKASPYEYMFLPDYIESGFAHATMNDKPLVADSIHVYESRPQKPVRGLPHPLLVFAVFSLGVLALSIWDYRRKKISRWFDILFFTVLGIIGVLLFFLWFFTDHKAAAVNFNILWALPTHVVVGIALLKPKICISNAYFARRAHENIVKQCFVRVNPDNENHQQGFKLLSCKSLIFIRQLCNGFFHCRIWVKTRKWLGPYFLITGGVGLLTLLLWPVLPQQLPVALIPVVLAILFRCVVIWKLWPEKINP
jgi:hypothetical protein